MPMFYAHRPSALHCRICLHPSCPCITQPDTNFLLGNLLAAKGNFSGALWHYRRTLQAEPAHPGAGQYILVVACYTRYHGNQRGGEQQCQTPAQVSG